jgi:predicted ferric reductase
MTGNVATITRPRPQRSLSGPAQLAAFWAILAGLAVLTLVHAYLLKPLMQRRQPFRVVSNRQIADRSFELVIRPDHAHSFHFRAGQFAWLNLGHSPFSLTEHPFSISSAPADLPDIAFTNKQSGDFTNRIGDIPLGTRALVDGPHGSFVLPEAPVEGLAFAMP